MLNGKNEVKICENCEIICKTEFITSPGSESEFEQFHFQFGVNQLQILLSLTNMAGMSSNIEHSSIIAYPSATLIRPPTGPRSGPGWAIPVMMGDNKEEGWLAQPCEPGRSWTLMMHSGRELFKTTHGAAKRPRWAIHVMMGDNREGWLAKPCEPGRSWTLMMHSGRELFDKYKRLIVKRKLIYLSQ